DLGLGLDRAGRGDDLGQLAALDRVEADLGLLVLRAEELGQLTPLLGAEEEEPRPAAERGQDEKDSQEPFPHEGYSAGRGGGRAGLSEIGNQRRLVAGNHGYGEY